MTHVHLVLSSTNTTHLLLVWRRNDLVSFLSLFQLGEKCDGVRFLDGKVMEKHLGMRVRGRKGKEINVLSCGKKL